MDVARFGPQGARYHVHLTKNKQGTNQHSYKPKLFFSEINEDLVLVQAFER